jgi:hypothetical protein
LRAFQHARNRLADLFESADAHVEVEATWGI